MSLIQPIALLAPEYLHFLPAPNTPLTHPTPLTALQHPLTSTTLPRSPQCYDTTAGFQFSSLCN